MKSFRIFMKKKIPFNDLYLQYLNLKKEIDEAISEVIKNSSFVRGKYVEEFEESFSSKIGTKYCISCGNGTDALYITLMSLGLKKDDEVIVPSHSWISTSEVVTQAGGKVVFCDTEDDYFTINPSILEKHVTSKTVGIIPVHLYGQPANLDEIKNFAKKYNLWIVEDCAQAHLAKYKGENVGTFGHAATFSFYPGKNLGAMGDAGAIVTNDRHLAEKMSMYARHGGLKKGEHKIEGINSRMDGLQGAILSIKLNYLEEWTESRNSISNFYNKKLKNLDHISCPKVRENVYHVWHLYVIKEKKRDQLKSYLFENGIQSIINYPTALPFLPAYKRYNHKETDFPISSKHQNQILSLPIFPEMNNDQLDYVVSKIQNFYEYYDER